jgi:hypothetical protein
VKLEVQHLLLQVKTSVTIQEELREQVSLLKNHLRDTVDRVKHLRGKVADSSTILERVVEDLAQLNVTSRIKGPDQGLHSLLKVLEAKMEQK